MRLRPADPDAVFRITHPGPIPPDRIQAECGKMAKVEITLEAGIPICESIGQALAPLGATAAALHFQDLAFKPMRYVQPTYSDTPDRVAFYSATRAPEEVFEIDFATATYGTNDGKPFIHCHAIWTDEEGQIQGGHILPFQAMLARPALMTAYVTTDAAISVQPDAETNFDLFSVSAVSPVGEVAAAPLSDKKMVVAKIRPNEDLVTAIETICLQKNVTTARILSGIGSTVGCVLSGQPVTREIPTELLVVSGTVATPAKGKREVDMDIILIDAQGDIQRGSPARGCNPVLICFELFLEITSEFTEHI